MPDRVWISPDFELQLATEADAYRRRVEQVRQQTDIQTGVTLARYADTWPGMNGNVAVALASAGADPLGQAARELAERSVRADLFSGDLGELVNPQNMAETPTRRPDLPAAPEGPTFSELGPAGKIRRGVTNTLGAFGRGTMLGLGFLQQEASAAISSAGEAALDEEPGFFADAWDNFTNGAARSELAMAFGELGRRISEDGFQFDDLYRDSEEFIGSGIMPAGELRERREADKERLQLDGTFVTPGRLIARTITDPGTRTYDTVSGIGDLATAVFLDPLNYVIPGAGAAGLVARKTAQAAAEGSQAAAVARRVLPGLVSYDERTAITNLQQAREWLPRFRGTLLNGVGQDVHRVEANDLIGGTRTGRRLVTWLTAETSPSRIRELSGGQIPAEVATTLSQIRQPADVIDYLATDVLGARVRRMSAPGIGNRVPLVDDGAGGLTAAPRLRDRTLDATRLPGVSRRLHGVRIAGIKPGQFFDTSDTGRMADTFSDYMRNAKVAEDEWRPLVDELMVSDRGRPGWQTQVDDVVARGLQLVVKEGEARGVDAAVMRRITQQVNSYHAELRSYAENELGNPFGHYGESTVRLGGEDVVAPSPILLEQAAHEIYSLPDPVEVRRAISALNRITTTTGWKATQTVLNGMMSMAWAPAQLLRFALPVRVIAENHARMAFSGLDTAFNHPMRYLAWMLGETDGNLARLAAKVGIDGQGGSREVLQQMDEFGAAMNVNGMALVGSGADAMPFPARELYNGDYVRFGPGHPLKPHAWAQRLAMMAGSTQIRAYIREGGVDGYARWLFKEGDGLRHELNTTIFKHNPIETVTDARRHARDLDTWVDALTRRDPRLLDEMETGAVAGVQIDGEVYDTQQIVDQLTAGNLLDLMPDTVRGSRHLEMTVNGDARFAVMRQWDRALDRMFEVLLSKPEDAVNRAPAFRQYFTGRLDEAAAYADEATHAQLIDYARELGVDITRARNGTDTFTTLGDVKTMAAAHAADEVKALLYDAHRRSNAADVFRLTFPFLEPWRDVVTAWTRIIARNPIAAQRGRQLTSAVQGGDGYFYENDYGESEFRVPAANWLFNAVAGGNETAGVRATGRTLGLNLIGSSVVPGVGPVISLPMAVLLPQRPSLEWLENQLFPFGRPGDKGGSFTDQVTDAVMPAWADRALTAAFADTNSDRVFANRVVDVMRVLAASGEFTDANGAIGADEQRRLVEEATTRARWLYAISAAATFASPTPTNFRFEADTPDGVLTFDALSREYYTLLQEDPDTAALAFIDKFGSNLGLMMQARSYAVTERSVGEHGARWELEHTDLEQYAPTTLGLFAPQYIEDPLEPGTFARQFITDDRHTLAPDDYLWLYNNIIGQAVYKEQRESMRGAANEPEGRAYLATLREVLRTRYPGYDATEAIKVRIPLDTEIAEITGALTASPQLADTDAGRGILAYLRIRDAARDASLATQDSVTAWASSMDPQMIILRIQVRKAAEDIILQYPDFATAYDRVFSRELPDDDPTVLPPARVVALPRWMREVGTTPQDRPVGAAA